MAHRPMHPRATIRDAGGSAPRASKLLQKTSHLPPSDPLSDAEPPSSPPRRPATPIFCGASRRLLIHAETGGRDPRRGRATMPTNPYRDRLIVRVSSGNRRSATPRYLPSSGPRPSYPVNLDHRKPNQHALKRASQTRAFWTMTANRRRYRSDSTRRPFGSRRRFRMFGVVRSRDQTMTRSLKRLTRSLSPRLRKSTFSLISATAHGPSSKTSHRGRRILRKGLFASRRTFQRRIGFRLNISHPNPAARGCRPPSR